MLNATSANGLLYALEQLPVQAGTRSPMVLNLVARTVSGPLDILCDHSDLYHALNTGWIILLARSPQAVYDMNLMAVRVGEHLRKASSQSSNPITSWTMCPRVLGLAIRSTSCPPCWLTIWPVNSK